MVSAPGTEGSNPLPSTEESVQIPVRAFWGPPVERCLARLYGPILMVNSLFVHLAMSATGEQGQGTERAEHVSDAECMMQPAAD